MNSKLAAWLATLLLSLSLLPSQAIPAFDPVDADPPAISEQKEPETPDTPDNPGEPEPSVSQYNTSAQAEDLDLAGGSH